jgi:hypothetical protein
VLLFVRDESTKKLKEFRFPGAEEFKMDNLRNWIRKTSGIYLPLPGCLEIFDKLANTLVTASNAGDKGKVMAEAEKALIRLQVPIALHNLHFRTKSSRTILSWVHLWIKFHLKV